MKSGPGFLSLKRAAWVAWFILCLIATLAAQGWSSCVTGYYCLICYKSLRFPQGTTPGVPFAAGAAPRLGECPFSNRFNDDETCSSRSDSARGRRVSRIFPRDRSPSYGDSGSSGRFGPRSFGRGGSR